MQEADTVHVAIICLPVSPYIIPTASTHTTTQINTYPLSSAGTLRSCISLSSSDSFQTKEKLKLLRESCREVITT